VSIKQQYYIELASKIYIVPCIIIRIASYYKQTQTNISLHRVNTVLTTSDLVLHIHSTYRNQQTCELILNT